MGGGAIYLAAAIGRPSDDAEWRFLQLQISCPSPAIAPTEATTVAFS
jgi:hypothetical protein